MLEKITNEELEFMEDFHNPVCMAESLFGNFNNLAVFGDDFGHLRNGQLPVLSYEYLVANNPKLSRKENFRLKEGAGNIWCYGGRKWGKCEDENSLCLLADGTYRKFKDLVGQEKEVISLNLETLKLETSNACFFDNGKKNCYKVILKGGKEIVVTENHPLLTAYGWKEAMELRDGDFVAVPRKYPIEGSIIVEENLAKLLGYLLGDGCCVGCQISFTNIDKELISEFNEIARFFGCEIRNKGMSYFVKSPNSKLRDKKGRKLNPINQIVKKYGLDKLSKDKVISEDIFRWVNKYVAIFLNRYFACDGNVSNDGKVVSVSSASHSLIYQIQGLLIRFGIHSSIKPKLIKIKEKYFNSWELRVSKDRDKFLRYIGIKSKDYKIKLKEKNFTTSDRIPLNIVLDALNKENEIENCKIRGYCVCGKRLSGKRYRACRVCSKMGNLNPTSKGKFGFKTYHPTRTKLEKLNKKFQSKNLQKVIDSDIWWEEIKFITKVPPLSTVAVSVPKHNNYISNNIVSHNTLCVEKIDLLLDILVNDGNEVGFSSYDAIHIRGVLEPVINVLENHPIFQIFKGKINRSPSFNLYAKNLHHIESVNMNLAGKNPGGQFFQKHFTKLYLEEGSFETDEVNKKRLASTSELGCVIRSSGMTNFTKWSPVGKIFYDASSRPWIANLPQYINPEWDEKENQKAIKQHGGENSLGYRIYVKGEVVEEGVSVFDMERIRPHYLENKIIKTFEIDKTTFANFKSLLVIDKPANAEQVYLCADIGESAPTEIIVISKVNKKYRYLYNITLYNLTDKQQYKIFYWLAKELNANFIAMDTTEGTGRAIFRSLAEVFPKENLVWCSFTQKIPIDFERDEKTNSVIVRNGKPAYKEEYVSEWSIKRLKDLLYEGWVQLPLDYKFDYQLNSVVSMQSGNRTVYSCVAEADHMLAAWRVFAIAQWFNEFSLNKPIKKTFCKQGIYYNEEQ